MSGIRFRKSKEAGIAEGKVGGEKTESGSQRRGEIPGIQGSRMEVWSLRLRITGAAR
jgi:hypothetical protein